VTKKFLFIEKVSKIKMVLVAVVFLLFSLLAAIFLYYRSYYYREISLQNSQDSSKVDIVIAPGDSVKTIAEKLVSAGVLRPSKMPDGNYVFYWYVEFSGSERVLQAGKFSVPKNLNMVQLVDLLKHASSQDLWISIIENQRIEEVADVIDRVLNSEENIKNSKFNKSEFIEKAKTARYEEFEFMQYIPEGKPLEGFLFPDTYLVQRDTDSEKMLKLLLSTFETKVYKRYRDKFSQNKYSLYELTTMASIIEREGRFEEERRMIADILFRRLETPGWKLEVDATLQYGLGWSEEEETWWRKNLPARNTPNEYNTSIHSGLPPTPICNPGTSAFDAVLNPKPNDFWYYMHDKNGVVHFAKTLEEHNENVRKYLW
jgi:UPF0755 protein